MLSLIAVYLLVCHCALSVVHCKLKFIDDADFKTITDLSEISSNESIVIEKEYDFSYHHNMTRLTELCSDHEIMKDIDIKYQSCFDTHGREFKLIQANDSDCDLYTEQKTKRSFEYNNERRSIRPFAPHFIVLDDVALYGHGDLMTLDGTSHYLGTCRQYGAPGYDSIDVKRKDVKGFITAPLLNLVTLWTENYYSTLISFLPRFLSILPILKMYPNILIAKNLHRTRTQLFIEPILRYYGIHMQDLNFMNIEYGKVYFIKQLIAPISSCKFIPLRFLTMIRTAVHDMYKIDINTSKNYIVINSGKGGSKSRSLNVESNEIYDKIKEIYGKDYNVVKYSTMLGKKSSIIHETLESTVTMFNRCKVYISTSGPALANIIFMNNGSHVIDVLSSEGNTYAQYAYLASAVGVSMVSVEGMATLYDAKINKITTEINFDEILQIVSSALAS